MEFWSSSIGGNLALACLNRVSSEELNLNFVMVDMCPYLVLKIRNMKCLLCQSWYAKVVFALNMWWIDTHMNLKYLLTEKHSSTEDVCWLKNIYWALLKRMSFIGHMSLTHYVREPLFLSDFDKICRAAYFRSKWNSTFF